MSEKKSSFLSCTVGRNNLFTQAEEPGNRFPEDLEKYDSCIGILSPMGGTVDVAVMNLRIADKETDDGSVQFRREKKKNQHACKLAQQPNTIIHTTLTCICH